MKLFLGTGVFMLIVAVALAAQDDTQAGARGNETNQTFGQCVSDAASVKNSCYVSVKATKESCLAAAADDVAEKKCKADYKKEKSQCKKDFKGAKNVCKRLKHNFIDTIAASFA